MKKIVFAVLIFLLPVFIKADYFIDGYRIDMTILENGDLNIIETFSMSGLYNGFERVINYQNYYSGYYGSKVSSVDNPLLYDAKSITLNEIRSVDFSFENDIQEVLNNSYLFEKKDNAKKGDYGFYSVLNDEYNETYKIYNPSKMNKDFYINYTLNNVVIVHDDIAEIAINIFDKLEPSIDSLKINIYFPNSSNLLKVWLHGDFDDSVEIIDNKVIKLEINEIINPTLDLRIVFDKNLILDINKKSNEAVYDKIIKIEEEIDFESNEANDEYEVLKEQVYNKFLKAEQTLDKNDYNDAILAVEQLQDDKFKTELLVKLINLESKIERKYVITKVAYSSLMGVIILGILILIYQIYKKDNNYKIKSNSNIFNYNPSLLGYLIRRKVTKIDLCSDILNLIDNKVISFEKTKNGKDYKFRKLKSKDLNILDERLVKMIFGDSDSITLFKLSKKFKDKVFISQYSNWYDSIIQQSYVEGFFEDLIFVKIFGICCCLIGIVIGALLLDNETYFSPIITITLCFLSLIYFIVFYKRTEKGRNIYFNFKLFKKRIINMNDKDFPSNLCKCFIYFIPLLGFKNTFKKFRIIIKKLDDCSAEELNELLINYNVIKKIIDNNL